jgi:hypothetical protein
MKQRMGSTEPFPAAVYEFARTQNLGIPLTEHRWGLSCLEVIWMSFAGFCVFLVLVLPGMPLAGPHYTLADLPGIMIMVALIVAGVWYFIERFRRFSSWRVQVFTNGFAYFKGRKVEIFRWEEIKHVHERLAFINWGRHPSFSTYRVERADGHRVTLDDHFRGISSLGRVIIVQVAAAQLPAARKRYRAGGEIDFGSVKISQRGVRQWNRSLSWAQIKEIVQEAGYIYVRSKEGGFSSWAPIPVTSISNVSVFLELVRESLNQPEQK